MHISPPFAIALFAGFVELALPGGSLPPFAFLGFGIGIGIGGVGLIFLLDPISSFFRLYLR
jgi:hypothetical protein